MPPSNCLILVVFNFDFFDASYIIAYRVFLHLEELGNFLIGVAGIFQSADVCKLLLLLRKLVEEIGRPFGRP